MLDSYACILRFSTEKNGRREILAFWTRENPFFSKKDLAEGCRKFKSSVDETWQLLNFSSCRAELLLDHSDYSLSLSQLEIEIVFSKLHFKLCLLSPKIEMYPPSSLFYISEICALKKVQWSVRISSIDPKTFVPHFRALKDWKP